MTSSRGHSNIPSLAPPLSISTTVPTSNPQSPTLPPYSAITTRRSSPPSESQAGRNREKQALRDAWARQDGLRETGGRTALGTLGTLGVLEGGPHYAQPPPSIDPNSSNSNSNSTSGDNTNTQVPALGSDTIVQSPEALGHTRNSASIDSALRRNSSRDSTGYLPPGMDVREALARCEDPTLGWSMQFWVTIADPVTQHVFFACPASGQCSWDPPVGAFIVPRSPDGEWWELADSSRNNRSYYYNTLTGKTQWTRPIHDAFVIPLGLIQRNALPARPGPSTRQSTGSIPVSAATSRETRNPSTPTRSGPRPPPSPRHTPRIPSGSSSSPVGPQSPPLLTPTLSFPEAVPTGNTPPLSFGSMESQDQVAKQPNTRPPRLPLSMVEESVGEDIDQNDGLGSGDSRGWWEKRRSKAMLRQFSPKKGKGKALPEGITEDTGQDVTVPQIAQRSAFGAESAPVTTSESALPKDEPLEPIFVESTVRTKRMSTGLHPMLPTDITSEIQNMKTPDLASRYFATKRTGVFRSRVPLERIMEWQKNPITSPLLVLSRSSGKDALTTFRVIQHVMGERDRPVEGARPITTSTSTLHVPLMGRKDANGSRIVSNGTSSANGQGHAPNGYGSKVDGNEKTIALEEIRWMIQLGVSAGEMRDEIYSQLVKQLTNNPDHDSIVLGFQLFCVLVNAFAPSKNFEEFVRTFLKKFGGKGTDGITIMAKYCLGKLEAMITKGGRGRLLTLGEIEHASDAAFYPSVYGEPLERIMELQARSYPALQIPVILPFLADGILALGGLQSEGIFRVPGDSDSVSELKSRIDRGHYQLQGIDDPHVASSLFKLWLRELEEPVIPTYLYNTALTASKSTTETLTFVSQLPTYHRRVLLFVISFAQLFMKPEVVEVTMMTPHNLALVLAPNILRTTSNHLITVFTNSSFESKFILQLLENMNPGDIDPEYTPTHGKAVSSVNENASASESRSGSGGSAQR